MTAIYKGLDANQLEAQYNLRARRGPDFDDLVKAWVERSAAYRSASDARVDLAYGDGERDRLDWFSGSDASGPALVFIHGGYWQRGDKSMYSFVSESFVRHGISVAVINYNLTPSVRMPRIPPQVQQAVSWIWKNAGEVGLDRDRLFVSGHSAGGHLTARMMATDWPAVDAELPADLVRGGIPMSGLYELEPVVHTSINDGPGMDIDEARVESPCNIPPLTDAPQLVVVGGGETDEFLRQSDAYAQQYRTRQRIMERLNVLEDDHFDLLNTLADDSSQFFAKCMQLIAEGEIKPDT